MDWSAIIVGCIAAIGSFAGNLSIQRKKSREDAIKEAERETRQEDRLRSIEHKLDIHNGYAEKLGSVEKSLIAMQKDIEYLRLGNEKEVKWKTCKEC